MYQFTKEQMIDVIKTSIDPDSAICLQIVDRIENCYVDQQHLEQVIEDLIEIARHKGGIEVISPAIELLMRLRINKLYTVTFTAIATEDVQVFARDGEEAKRKARQEFDNMLRLLTQSESLDNNFQIQSTYMSHPK